MPPGPTSHKPARHPRPPHFARRLRTPQPPPRLQRAPPCSAGRAERPRWRCPQRLALAVSAKPATNPIRIDNNAGRKETLAMPDPRGGALARPHLAAAPARPTDAGALARARVRFMTDPASSGKDLNSVNPFGRSPGLCRRRSAPRRGHGRTGARGHCPKSRAIRPRPPTRSARRRAWQPGRPPGAPSPCRG